MHNKQTLPQLLKEERTKSSRCYISNILPTPVTIIILHDFLCGLFRESHDSLLFPSTQRRHKVSWLEIYTLLSNASLIFHPYRSFI